MTYKIGIAITTRNRPDVLKLTLAQFEKYWPQGAELVIMDDNSTPPNESACMASKLPLSYLYSNAQIGVARGKNQCLRKLQDFDYVFLFDDDCFPIADGWAEWYIAHSERTGQQHFIFAFAGAYSGKMKSNSSVNGLQTFLNGTGCFMFLTRAVIEKLGGYNKDYGYWGHEHNGYSKRVFNAGLNTIAPFLSPIGCEQYIYSLDLQGVPIWAQAQVRGKFKSAENEWWKKLQCVEKKTIQAYEYDCKNNYHQPL